MPKARHRTRASSSPKPRPRMSLLHRTQVPRSGTFELVQEVSCITLQFPLVPELCRRICRTNLVKIGRHQPPMWTYFIARHSRRRRDTWSILIDVTFGGTSGEHSSLAHCNRFTLNIRLRADANKWAHYCSNHRTRVNMFSPGVNVSSSYSLLLAATSGPDAPTALLHRVPRQSRRQVRHKNEAHA